MAETTTTESIPPIVVDVGSRSKADIRRLKEGRGRLMREIDEVVQRTRVAAPPDVPIVVIYRQKRRRGNRLRIPTPLDLFR
jgi:hypothetical protein